MMQNLLWEADRRSAGQENQSLFVNPKLHYTVYNDPPLHPWSYIICWAMVRPHNSQMNQVRFALYFFNFLILSHRLRTPLASGRLPFRPTVQNAPICRIQQAHCVAVHLISLNSYHNNHIWWTTEIIKVEMNKCSASSGFISSHFEISSALKDILSRSLPKLVRLTHCYVNTVLRAWPVSACLWPFHSLKISVCNPSTPCKF